MAQLAQRLGLDLADPLAGHAKLGADLGEGVQPVAVQAEAQLYDSEKSLSWRERLGWRSLRSAFVSIWRMRSRVTPNS